MVTFVSLWPRKLPPSQDRDVGNTTRWQAGDLMMHPTLGQHGKRDRFRGHKLTGSCDLVPGSSSCRNLALYPCSSSGARRVCGSSFPRHLEKTHKEPQKFNCRGERAGYLLTVGVVWIDFLPWYKHFCGSSSSCFLAFPSHHARRSRSSWVDLSGKTYKEVHFQSCSSIFKM